MSISIRRILLPTDFSESSLQAQNYALSLASAYQAELHVLHVVGDPTPLPSVTAFATRPRVDPLPEILQDAKNRLAAALADALKNDSGITCVVRPGDPVNEILQYADLHTIDLIVIGTHGRRGLSHMLIGSVVEKVVRAAKCPVLSVHPKGHQFVMESTSPNS
jgi:nucleotide-binding universal stress UspA family protein